MKSFADFISEATPRGKAIQRGKISKAEAQRRQAREDRKRAAQERRDDKAKAGIDALIGSDEERKVAAAARANPKAQRAKALKRTIADRMAKGAKDHGLDEERRQTEIGITGQPIPNKKLGAKKRYEFEKKRRENLKKMPGDAPGESKLIQLMKDRAEREGGVTEDWQKVNKGDRTDGMSKKAVDAYRRENPGSKLKTAVTGKVKAGSKDAKRRKSFCARSKGQQDMHNIDCSKTPDKPVCKARRRWKC